MSERIDALAARPRYPETDLPVRAVLRVHREPCTYVDDWTIHERLTVDPRGFIHHLAVRMSELASGRRALELPTKQIFRDQDGDFRVMPCITGSGRSAVKTVKVVGTNLVQSQVPDQITVGKALRLDPVENFVTHVFDACLLSSARTGACAALALRQLSTATPRVGIVGAGRVAYYAAIYLAAGGVDTVQVCDRDPARAEALAVAVHGDVDVDVDVECFARPLTDVLDCDVLVVATTARSPFIAPADTSASVVMSVGADSEDQHELTPEWAKTAAIYIDSVDALDVGDLRAWRRLGLVAAQPPTILDLFRGGSPPPAERRVFVSTGSALLDNLTIEYLLREFSVETPHDDRPDRSRSHS